MHIVKYILCYANAVLIVICAISFQIHNGTDVNAFNNMNAFNYEKAIDVVIFGILSFWAFTIGALITLVQLIYGIIKTSSAEKRKPFHKHMLAAALISIVAYVVIFTTDFYYVDADGNRVTAEDYQNQNSGASDATNTSEATDTNETGLGAYPE